MAVLSTLLDHRQLARLERLRLVSVSKMTDRGRGARLAGKGGSSIDFVDYRDYAPGDDLRHVDWNAFARLQRPYLKQFRREEDRHLVVVIDVSGSMAYPGKLELARQLAAALLIMGLGSGDRVSLWTVGGDGRALQRLPPLSGRAWMRRALTAVESITVAGGSRTIGQGIADLMTMHHGRGIAVLLSDFLGDGDHRVTMTRLLTAGLEPWAVQVLSPAEMEPEINGDIRLVDCETGEVLEVSAAGDLLGMYHAYRQQLQAELEQACTGRRGRFSGVIAADPFDSVIQRWQRMGWIQ